MLDNPGMEAIDYPVDWLAVRIETLLARYLAPSEFTELQTQLYSRIQTDENPNYVELLAWSFIQ